MGEHASESGKFELYYRKGWAFLTVSAPRGSGLPVYPEDVENRMKILGIPRVATKAIRDIIDAASGQAVPLVEWPGGQALTAAISVEIAADRMSASITVKAPKKGAAPPTLDDLLAELRRAGVVYGIDRDAMNILISKSLYEKPVPAAAGTVPVFGRAHRIVYRFNVNRGRPYLEMDFGRINLKELNFIDNCRTGDLLAELEMPILAVDGRTVTGETIPAQTDSQIVPLVPGTNTLLSPDRTQLYAQCDGNVKLVDGAVLVEPVIIVKNVNYETRISASMAPWSWKAASPMASSLKPVEIFKSETASARLFSRRREIYS